MLVNTIPGLQETSGKWLPAAFKKSSVQILKMYPPIGIALPVFKGVFKFKRFFVKGLKNLIIQ